MEAVGILGIITLILVSFGFLTHIMTQIILEKRDKNEDKNEAVLIPAEAAKIISDVNAKDISESKAINEIFKKINAAANDGEYSVCFYRDLVPGMNKIPFDSFKALMDELGYTLSTGSGRTDYESVKEWYYENITVKISWREDK